jgi:uncharacterized membrane protein YdjX (TVP38/TMEM64 family)
MAVARRLAPLMIVLAAMAIVWTMGWHRHLTLEAVAANRDNLHDIIAQHRTLALLAYVSIYVVIVGLSLPGGTVLTLTGGLLFGWLGGALAAVVGATAGATIVFLIARTAMGDMLASRAGPLLGKLRDGFSRNALNYMLFLRLVPAFPFWLVNLAPALLGVSLRSYVVGTFLGIIPGTLAIASMGVGLDAVIAAAKADLVSCVAAQGAAACELSIKPGALLNAQLVAALVLLGIVALLPLLIRRRRRRDSA